MPASFKEQITSTKPLHIKDEEPAYLAMKIRNIHCTDDKGNEITLPNSPSIKMWVTEKNNKRKSFYFSTVIFRDGKIIGGESRTASPFTKGIPFDSISRIEIQVGRKNYRPKLSHAAVNSILQRMIERNIWKSKYYR